MKTIQKVITALQDHNRVFGKEWNYNCSQVVISVHNDSITLMSGPGSYSTDEDGLVKGIASEIEKAAYDESEARLSKVSRKDKLLAELEKLNEELG